MPIGCHCRGSQTTPFKSSRPLVAWEKHLAREPRSRSGCVYSSPGRRNLPSVGGLSVMVVRRPCPPHVAHGTKPPCCEHMFSRASPDGYRHRGSNRVAVTNFQASRVCRLPFAGRKAGRAAAQAVSSTRQDALRLLQRCSGGTGPYAVVFPWGGRRCC